MEISTENVSQNEDSFETGSQDFKSIRQQVLSDGVSPLWLLTGEEPRTDSEAHAGRLEAASGDSEKKMAERMTDILALLSQSGADIGYRQLRTVISELMHHNPSRRSLRLLVETRGFNIDWILFGLGEPYLPKTGYLYEEGRLGGANLRNFRLKNGLGGAEMLWLWGTTISQYLTGRKSGPQDLGISASLLLRTLDRNPEIRLLPTPPTYQDVLPALKDALEELSGMPVPEQYRETLERLKTTPNKIAVLFGTNVWSGYIWKSGKQQPRVPVLRLFQILMHLLQRYGGKGFLRFLDVVDMEVKARGMGGGVAELIKSGIWPGRTNKGEDNGEG